MSSFTEYLDGFTFIKSILQRVSDPVQRARKSHKYVESYTNEVLKNPTAQKLLGCHKGCSTCCHTQVSINSDEAALLAVKVVDEGFEIDLKKLYIQGTAENDAKKWFALPFDMRQCVFVGNEGQCRIYSDRPSVCRTNNTLGDPSRCDTSDGIEKPIRLLNTEKADMAVIASFLVAGEGGTLPYLLWKELAKLPAVESSRSTKPKKASKAKLNRVKKGLFKFLDM